VKRSFFFLCFVMVSLTGCRGFEASSAFKEANVVFSQGNFNLSLLQYQKILDKYPPQGDRALFLMGIIHAYPKNKDRDYGKAMDSFQRLLKEYPQSPYRHDSEMMIFYLEKAVVKDQTISAQQVQLENLRQQAKSSAEKIGALEKEIYGLKQKLFDTAMRHGLADKIVIEKKARRLSVMSGGEVVKAYKIALGGNPEGAKEREGDNKTPEGTYFIDSRSNDTHYHLSLHISYPNEADKKRAKELGVSPGGGIMIHGIKNGFGWVGNAQSQIDWTQGCVAVTDEEIEEIDRLAPNGTVVEIRP
jgi:L,D-peptidoglycan transpeptidase YkuD (ErfK/YbiS/YcfS/YnhG family)